MYNNHPIQRTAMGHAYNCVLNKNVRNEIHHKTSNNHTPKTPPTNNDTHTFFKTGGCCKATQQPTSPNPQR